MTEFVENELLVPSLLWTPGIITIFAPLSAWKLKRS
jgi:hypothetical protein